MGAYPDNGSMADLLTAMKDVARQDEANLTYVKHYRIKLGGWWWAPWDTYALYFEPQGSPETFVAEKGPLNMKWANHIVNIECIVPYQNPDVEEAIVGRESVRVGLADMMDDVMDYYEHNTLSLTGLEPELPPVCEVLEGGYQDVQLDETFFIRVGTIRYQARTKHFVRSS